MKLSGSASGSETHGRKLSTASGTFVLLVITFFNWGRIHNETSSWNAKFDECDLFNETVSLIVHHVRDWTKTWNDYTRRFWFTAGSDVNNTYCDKLTEVLVFVLAVTPGSADLAGAEEGGERSAVQSRRWLSCGS